MDDLSVTQQVLVALFGAGGGGAAAVKLFGDFARKRRSRNMDTGLGDIRQIYEELQTLLGDVSADRILVIKSENGGGLPRPGCVVKSSVVHEVFTKELPSIHETWQRVPLDQQYSEILSILSTGQWVWRSTASLQSPSVLLDLVESDVRRMAFARICGTNNALWYIALHFKTAEEIPDSDRATTQNAIYRLRVLFENHQTLVKRESNE